MTDMEVLPASVAQREVTIAGITLRMHILDDGQRVIEKAGMDRLMTRMASGKLTAAEAQLAATWCKGDA